MLLSVITSITSHALWLSRHIILSLVMWHIIVLIDVIWFIRYKLFVWSLQLRHQSHLAEITYCLDEIRGHYLFILSWSITKDNSNFKLISIIKQWMEINKTVIKTKLQFALLKYLKTIFCMNSFFILIFGFYVTSITIMW